MTWPANRVEGNGRRRRRGLPRAITEVAWQLRQQGLTELEIADLMRQQRGCSALVALRLARGWSQRDAAEAWNARWPDEPKTFKSFSYWENWPNKSGREPDLRTLDRLAQLYTCSVSDVLADHGNYRPTVPKEPSTSMPDVDPMVVDGAFDRAEMLEREVHTRWPYAFAELDWLQANPVGHWPAWCLLPSAAAALVLGEARVDGPVPVAAVEAIHTWRYARSTYIFDPKLASRLLHEGVAELGGLDAFVGLPERCAYIAGGQAGWPGAGLLAHLAYNSAAGRPELRLVLDLGEGGLDQLTPITVYLDRNTLTEALADQRAAWFRGRDVNPGAGPLDATIARLADTLDGLLALVAHLARAEVAPANATDQAEGTGRPVRGSRPVIGRRVWWVGDQE
jgi:transcriptional regulator with XRE-family HTH domain